MQRANRHRGRGLGVAAFGSAALAAGAWAQSAPVECRVVDPHDPRLGPIVMQLEDLEPMLADVRVQLEGLNDLRPRIEHDIAIALEGLNGEWVQLEGLDHQLMQLEGLDDLGPEISAKVAVALKGMEGKLARLDGLKPLIEARVACALAGLDGELARIGDACVVCPPEGQGEVRAIVVQPEGAAPKARRIKVEPKVIRAEPKVKIGTLQESGEQPKVRVRTLRQVEPRAEVVEVRPEPSVRFIPQRSGGGAGVAAPAPRTRVRVAPRAEGGTPHTVHVAPHAMGLGGVAAVPSHREHARVRVVTPRGLHSPGGVVAPQSPKVRTLHARPRTGGAGVHKEDCTHGRCPHGCGPC